MPIKEPMPFSAGPFVFAVMATAVVAGGYLADNVPTIDASTKVPLSMLLTVAVSVWGAATWVQRRFGKIMAHLDRQDGRLEALNEEFKKLPCQQPTECPPKHDSKHR